MSRPSTIQIRAPRIRPRIRRKTALIASGEPAKLSIAAKKYTVFGVHLRITALLRWHYRHTAAQMTELLCIDNVGGSCSCQ